MAKEIEIHFDLETTARGPDKSPEAHFKENKVVMAGWCVNGGPIHRGDVNALCKVIDYQSTRGTILLVAHNLKFDLKYLLRDRPDMPWHKYTYHCTMTGIYRATGHRQKFCSLEKLCDHYGIPFKKGLDLGALIKQGIDVDDIDKDDLWDYLRDDVHHLHSGYSAMCYHNNIHELNLDYILPLARMELNGLPLDIPKTKELAKTLETDKQAWTKQVEDVIIKHMEWGDGTPLKPGDFKPLAPRTMSYYLTGKPEHGCGGAKTAKPEKHIKFKKGEYHLLDYSTIKSVWGSTKVNPNLGYPINASVVEELCKLSKTVARYKEAKDANKLLNTYCLPFLAEAQQTGGTIHPKLNTCATNTGRLSSSSPNGQNIPPIIRNLIKSTVGELYEIDWQQLEMVGAATLSNCPTMINDIKDGRDIHYETGRTVMGWTSPSDMTKETRRQVKAVNFGLLYGGGAAGIAASSGLDKKLVKNLIDSFYNRYPTIKEWQEYVLATVKSNTWVQGTKDGFSYKGSIYTIPPPHGGRTFYFEESKSPLWMQKQGDHFSFKPTETKNYPIQGFAGGDIVMLALTILDDVLANTHAVMRMTVHDSIVIDWVAGKENDLHNIMTKVCNIVETHLNIPVPLRFDVEHDTHWL